MIISNVNDSIKVLILILVQPVPAAPDPWLSVLQAAVPKLGCTLESPGTQSELLLPKFQCQRFRYTCLGSSLDIGSFKISSSSHPILMAAEAEKHLSLQMPLPFSHTSHASLKAQGPQGINCDIYKMPNTQQFLNKCLLPGFPPLHLV